MKRDVLDSVTASLPAVLVATTSGQDTLYIYGKGLIAQFNPDGSRQYLHTDALGSSRVLTDGAANQVATYSYDAFGSIRSQSGSTSIPFTFTGE